MMPRKILLAYLVATGCSVLGHIAHVHAKSSNPQEFINKDGSRMVVENHSPKQYVVAQVTKRQTSQLLKLKPSGSTNPSFFSVSLIDIDQDGFGDVEQSGNCGNRVCEKIIYRFNPATKKYVKLFSGAYEKVFLDKEFLITSGGSGCCSYEYQLYKFAPQKHVVEKAPSYVATVSNIGEGKDNKIKCAFTNKEAKTVAPLKDSWKQLCEVYGKNYVLTAP
jgi:hypothetical protein